MSNETVETTSQTAPTTMVNEAPENPAQLDPASAPPPAEESAAAAPAPPPEEAPQPLTLDALEVPEGLQLTNEEGEPLPEAAEFLDLANETGLNPEAASKFLSAHHKLLESAFQTAVQEHQQQWENLQASWQTEVRALPEFAGEAFGPSMAKIAKVLDKYGSKEARDAFDVTGAGNNPYIVQMLKKIADDLTEAAPVSGDPATGSAKDRASRMFGSS